MVAKPSPAPGEGRPKRDWTGSFSGSFSRSFTSSGRFLPGSSRRQGGAADSAAAAAFESIVAEFTARWERGEGPPAEEYLDRLEAGRSSDVIELIYHEYCLAESLGLDPDPSDYLRRFPDQGDSLHRLFQLHGVFSSTQIRDLANPTVLPEVGDEIGPYQLVRELGRGSFARVFLAEQADLDHRLIVVKVSTKRTLEPRLLARARHSHIVEVLWHGSADDEALQLICMPFLGGATLATVLGERRAVKKPARAGRALLRDLDRVSAPEYPRASLSRPAREIIEGLSYSKAVAWIVARLAEALDHAFERGVAHGDVKPSNILLTADGNPMLLDFNLAVGWQYTGPDELPADAGGTLAYMAPERLMAVANPSAAPIPSAANRHRADIFAIGVVLLEALTGAPPDLPQAKARTRPEIAAMLTDSARRNGEALRWLSRSRIPRTLHSILERCLAPDPADRYRRAAELAEDLDRWRTNRPLAFAKEPPWRSSAWRSIQRHRVSLAAAAVALVVAGAALFFVWDSFQHSLRDQAEDKLALVWDRDDSGAFRFQRFGQGRILEDGDPAENALRQLDRYDVLGDADWRTRDDVRALPPSDREELEVWILEQVLRYTRALGARPNSPKDWQRGMAVLERVSARERFGPLETQRRLLQRRLGAEAADQVPRAAAPSASSRWIEDYLLGFEAEPSRVREALAHYQHALAARPELFWGHYRAASVAYRLGDFSSATDHLKRCVARRPNNPALRSQLAACLFAIGRFDDALEECNRALTIDPDHTESTRTRTFIRGQLGQTASQTDDLDRFDLLERNPAKALSLKLTQDRLQSGGKPAPEEVGSLHRMLLDLDPDDHDSRLLLATRLWQLGDLEGALAALNRILERDPDQVHARYDRAMLLAKLKREGSKSDVALLVANPRFEELIPKLDRAIGIYHHRTNDLLKAGQTDEALRIALLGVVQSTRYKKMRGESFYNLARAYAAAAKSNPKLLPKVADQLRIAHHYHQKFLKQWFERDLVFEPLRGQIRPLLSDLR